jgi:hypothetical protein
MDSRMRKGWLPVFRSSITRLGHGVAIAVLTAGSLALAMSPAHGAAPLRPVRPHDLAAPAANVRGLRPATVPSNITIADPPVSVPDTTPCSVMLFTNVAFEGFTPQPFQFAPPTACPAPWSKVVLSVSLSVTEGVQFDRTATIGLGAATIFFGTTAEPFSNEGPSWTVGRDLTDETALFTSPQAGQVSIGNVVNQQYTGIIYGSASLLFYPPDKKFPAPRVADIVVPLADSNGNPVPLASPTSQLAATFTPPTNVENAYLDVIAQSQSSDEFWYTCVPNDLAGPLDDCGNTSFRETDATVDNVPAGVAPVYPWIYTGGIDPFLWAPTPGVQTLNLIPYRVDLTPFAASLDNGAPHQVALSVFNADNYFAVTGNLLLFLDHGATKPLTGALDVNTLTAPPPEKVIQQGKFTPEGTIDTLSGRTFTIAGHLLTSHGVVKTQITSAIAFQQYENVVNSSTQFEQDITQDETATTSTLVDGPGLSSSQQSFDFPLNLAYNYTVNSNGSARQTTYVRQGYTVATTANAPHQRAYWSIVSNTVKPHDTLNFAPGGGFNGFSNNASSQIYQSRDSNGVCYGRLVASKSLVVVTNRPTSCGGNP